MTKPHEVAWSENSAQVTTQAIPIAIDLRGGVLEVAGGFTDCIQRSMDFILKNDGIHTENESFYRARRERAISSPLLSRSTAGTADCNINPNFILEFWKMQR